jgi:hypothetical protein
MGADHAIAGIADDQSGAGGPDLGLLFAHVQEIVGKLRLDGSQSLTVQHNLYVGFGAVGAVLEVTAILSCWAVWWMVRRRPAARPSLVAALCTSLALAVWVALVAPTNAALSGWTAATLPADWTSYRNQ